MPSPRGSRYPARIVSPLVWIFLLAFACSLAPRGSARAGTLRAASLDELLAGAARVVSGRVVALGSHPVGDVPCTDVTLAVDGVFKGPEEARVTFSLLGGVSGPTVVAVDGEPRLRPGEDVVVFLERNEASNRTWVMGGVQGCYGVRDGRLEATGLPLAEFAARMRGRLAGSPRALTAAPADSAPPGGRGPRVTGVSPKRAGSAGDTPLFVTVRGTGFGSEPGGVNFPDWFRRSPGRVLAWSDTLIRVQAPVPDTGLSVEVTSGQLEVVDAAGLSSLPNDDCPSAGCQPASYFDVNYNYPRFRWAARSLPVKYWLYTLRLPACMEPAVRGAFDTWNAVDASFARFVEAGQVVNEPSHHDHLNVVGSLQPWPFSHSWIAATIPWAHYDPDSAVLDEVDTAINTSDFQFRCDTLRLSSDVDLQTVMTHEVGHWLRLRHVNTDAEIMQVVSFVGRSRHDLGVGDRAGVSHIYPSYGTAVASRQGHELCPAGDADSVVVDVRVLDREGQPRAGVPAESVYVDLSGSEQPAAIGGRVPAGAPTDADGRTRVTLHDLSGRRLAYSTPVVVGAWTQALPVAFQAWSLDVSGDGRVGPEDLGLTYASPGLDTMGLQRADTAEVLRHLGHAAGQPIPRLHHLAGAFPNPFNTSTSVAFSSASRGPVRVEVLDVTGARVRRLWNGEMEAGRHQVAWDGAADDGRPVASGVYLVRVTFDGTSLTRKVLRIR